MEKDMSKLYSLIKFHEGLKLKPYKCTAGKLTIGVGHNLEDNGISEEVAYTIFREDVAAITAELYAAFPWVSELSAVRQDALTDMAFNLGMPRFSQFKKMLKALENGDWGQGAIEMLDSKWAVQVGARAQHLANMIRTDSYGGIL